MMLISLQDARDQTRSNSNPDDTYMETLIRAVSAAIANYVDVSFYIDSDGTIPVDSNDYAEGVPEEWRMACMIEVARHYRFRENDAEDHIDAQFGYGYPFGKTAIGLLFPYRMPGIA